MSPSMAKNILLVEDEVFIRDMYEKVLREKGFTVDTAEDGEVAITKLAKPENHYDLVLLDIMLPKFNGIYVLKKVREDAGPNQHSPVFLLSNLGMDNIIAQAVSLGAEKYFIKSDFLPQDIANEISNFFGGTTPTA